MATTTKEKVPVDHSAISGTPPKPTAAAEVKAEPFITTIAKTLENAGINVEIPAPVQQKPKGLLSNVKRGREFSPPRILLVGTEGIGKSTFAADAPNSIIIPTEDGLNHIDCAKWSWDDGKRNKANTYEEVKAALIGLALEPHEFQTIAIDSVDWLERLIWDHVCRRTGVTNIQKVEKGYGKGFEFAMDEWREILGILTRCQVERGTATILVAHAKVEKFEDPENPAYDRYVPRLHKFAQGILSEWCDAVLFASYKRTVRLVEGKNTDERPIGVPIGADGGLRVIRTVDSPSAKAKNRYGLPSEIPLSWASFQDGFVAYMERNKISA